MKTLAITLAGLALALTPALCAPTDKAAPSYWGGGLRLSTARTKVEVFSGGKAVAKFAPHAGTVSVRADVNSTTFAGGSTVARLRGHVSVVVTQGGRVVYRLDAPEARVVAQTPG